jgi:hypothetical protein
MNCGGKILANVTMVKMGQIGHCLQYIYTIYNIYTVRENGKCILKKSVLQNSALYNSVHFLNDDDDDDYYYDDGDEQNYDIL